MNESNVKNRWNLTDDDRNQFLPILKNYLYRLEKLTVEEVEHMDNEEFALDLSDMLINPFKVKKLLEELGYKEVSFDRNGWEMDFWIEMKRTDSTTFPSTCEKLTINCCGMTFELRVYPTDIDS